MLTNDSLEDWQRWSMRRQGLPHRLRVRLTPTSTARLAIYASKGADKRRPVIVALDSVAASQRSSLIRPAEILIQRGTPVAVVAPESVGRQLQVLGLSPVGAISPQGWAATAMPPPIAVLSAGHYMSAGWVGWKLSTAQEIPYLVVQHGVLTPHAPPLPADAHLLAWSTEDGRFWSSGRREIVSTVVGSQGLWQAAQVHVDLDPHAPLCFLGQLHGAELPRAVTLRTVKALRTEGSFVYRPHPGEQDWRSRLQHAVWRHQGVKLDDGARPLTNVGAPVGAVFSTGILEAAAAGLPSYGVCERPPTWIRELWDRYRIGRRDSGHRTEVDVPSREPAQAIADIAGGEL